MRFTNLVIFLFLGAGELKALDDHHINIISNFTGDLVKTQQAIIFACNKRDLLQISRKLLERNQLVRAVNLRRNYSLPSILTRNNHARTAVIVNCACKETGQLIRDSSDMRFFNKTYQWLLIDSTNVGVSRLLTENLPYFGPNAQVTYVNGSVVSNFELWDVYSKGLHLGAPLEMKIIAEYSATKGLLIINDILQLQGFSNRGQFNGLQMRGVTVVDRDNIITNDQIEGILSSPKKQDGVSSFVKYHYDLVCILREHLNFTVNWRNSRGWAGRFLNTSYRLGLLGVVQRNEADVVGSGAFNRINRFAEFDIIHQSWKLETAFLYRFTPDLKRHNDQNGNFLAPFDMEVWLFAVLSLCLVNAIWRFIEWMKDVCWRQGKSKVNNKKQKQKGLPKASDEQNEEQQQQQGQLHDELFYFHKTRPRPTREARKQDKVSDNETTWSGILLKSFAAVCQQGMEPVPKGLSSRTVILTVFFFSLVMYNYYTSSVVGGLLSGGSEGLSSVDEIVASPVKVSFEDIGYYRILFKERFSKPEFIRRLYDRKVLTSRSADDLPIYANIEQAIPYLKTGGYAFHCEVIDAYPEIAKMFDSNEICDLRSVSGLLEDEVINMILTKNSQYSEIFRNILQRSTESGLVNRIQHKRRPEKPRCQALYRVFPITISGVASAYLILCGGYVCGLVVMFIERAHNKRYLKRLG